MTVTLPKTEVERLAAKFCPGFTPVKPKPAPQLTPTMVQTRCDIVAALYGQGWMETRQVANEVGKHITTTKGHLNALRAEGRVEWKHVVVGRYQHRMDQWRLKTKEANQ